MRELSFSVRFHFFRHGAGVGVLFLIERLTFYLSLLLFLCVVAAAVAVVSAMLFI